MVEFLKLVNFVVCYIAMQMEWTEAYVAYAECLRTAQGTAGDLGCYNELLGAIGEVSVDFVGCLI